jgi:formylglycine-generating enzyme required for sulfatase activity
VAGRIATNSVYRLPTEAEWEYACRAWTSTRFSYGDDPGYTNLTDYAWYWDNSGGTTHPVGQKLPNPWGLYDMHGNVFEWCQDWFDTYPGGIALDPQGPATGSARVIRGGDWLFWGDVAGNCRSAYRCGDGPDAGSVIIGFRVVLAPGQP